jgi:hypothetical protein
MEKTKNSGVRLRNVRFIPVILIIAVAPFLISWAYPADTLIDDWDANRDTIIGNLSGLTNVELLDYWYSDDPMERVAANIVLIERGPESVIPDLINLPFDNLRPTTVLRVLDNIWGADAVPVLMEYFDPSTLFDVEQTENYAASWRAVDGFNTIGPDADVAIPGILSALDEPRDTSIIFPSLYRTLANIGVTNDEIVDKLIEGFEGELVLDYEDVCYALGKLASPDDRRVIDVLQNFIEQDESNDTDGDRLMAARTALYVLGVDRDEIFADMENYTADWDSIGWFDELVYMGDDRSFYLLCYLAEEYDGLPMLNKNVIASVTDYGPEPRVIRCLAGFLNNQPYNTEDLGGWDFMVDYETEYDKRFLAATNLARFGAASESCIPDMLWLYRGVIDEDEESPMRNHRLVELASDLLRIHEDIPYWPYIK